jgi:hypothetical protein
MALETELQVASDDVSFEAVGVTVKGTIVRPRAPGRFGAVLLIAESGPTDRNWEGPGKPGRNGSGRLLAEALARHGLVVLRYDKRGSGETPLGESLSWADYLAEQRAAVEFLRADVAVDPTLLFLVGHGEGALHAMRLAAEPGIDPVAIVLLASPGRPLRELVLARAERQLRAARVPSEEIDRQLSALSRAVVAIEEDADIDVARLDVLPVLRAQIEALLNPQSIRFVRELLAFDPARSLAALDVATVLLQGDKDAEVDPAQDLDELGRFDRVNVFDRMIKNADHVFKYEERDRAALDASTAVAVTYNARGRRLSDDLVPTIVRLLEDLDPVRLATGRGRNFGRVGWPSLRPLQCALSSEHSDDALRVAAALDDAALGPEEQMWRSIYRGVALDRLDRREEAIRAYRDARGWYPHGITGRGLFQPIRSLRHLDRMGDRCRDAPVPRRANADAFAALQQAIDERYSYRDRLGLDWPTIFAQHREALVGATSPSAFADEAVALLANARDPHVRVEVDGVRRGTFFPDVVPNFVRETVTRRVSGWIDRGACLSTGHLGNVGYALVPEWNLSRCGDLGERFQTALGAELEDARALVVDVRPNIGGSETLAESVAGHFVRTPVVYARQEVWDPSGPGFRSGERILDPIAPLYERPVVVLMGRANVSSNEAFLLMMRAAGARLLGERSYGSSGNPQPTDLGNGVIVHLSSWRSLLPDGSPLEGVGISPDRVVADPVTATRDPVLEAALAMVGRRPRNP